MDPGRVVFDSGVARRAGGGGGAQMLLFGGGGSANSGGFFRGVPTAVMGIEGEARLGAKRPFFTTHEEVMVEEYYDEQAPEKKRRLTAEQVKMLERSFEEENKLEPERKTELARRLGMAPRQVAVWFQNRRARWKTQQLETDFDRLKAAFDALAADHQGLLDDNHRLRAQVISLTEKLEGKETSPPPSSATITTAVQEVDQPDDHTSDTGCATVDDALPAPPPTAQQQLQLKDDLLSSNGATDNDGGGAAVVVFDVAEGTNDVSCESAYFAAAAEAYERDFAGQYALSSSEDGGAVSDEGCSFDLPDDAMFGAAAGVVHHAAAGDEEAPLGSWTAWFWS